MTATRPPDRPPTRRAAREQRDGTDERGPETDADAAATRPSPALWDDLDVPDWASVASHPERTRSNFVPATAPIATATDPAPAELPAPADPPSPVASTPRPEPSTSTGPTRRSSRADELIDASAPRARHVRTRRAARIRLGFAVAAVSLLLVGGTAAVTAALSAPDLSPTAGLLEAADPTPEAVPLPQPVEAIPAPTISAAPALVDVCADPGFVAAVGSHDDATAIALAGGAGSFRTAVASGTADCVPLDDPAHLWTLVNKTHPFDPIDFRPSPLATPSVRDISGGSLREDAAAALTQMVTAAGAAGAGEIALDSGFRSYRTQRSTYGNLVASQGTAQADMVSARPGYSEHQSGLAADVTACAGGCVGLDEFAGTPQQEWVAANSWQYGWVVRYEDGCTGITGYSPEPWHLRYLGAELAAEYHEGGWHTLEEFLGAPASPGYAN